MKKILLIFAVLFASCFEVQVKPREVNAQGFDSQGFCDYGYRTEVISGMSFGIWYTTNGTSQTGYAVEVVNLTKEALEVELLEAQVDELRRKQKRK